MDTGDVNGELLTSVGSGCWGGGNDKCASLRVAGVPTGECLICGNCNCSGGGGGGGGGGRD